MATFTLSEVPGYVDIPDSILEAEDIAFAFPLQAQLGNAKFGMARLEAFRYFLKDGETAPLPVSSIDGYKYQHHELIYHWTWYHTGNMDNEGRTSAPGNIVFLNSKVQQFGEQEPGKVNCEVWYHVQGDGTTRTNDGQLTVTVIGQRRTAGLIISDLPVPPATIGPISSTALDCNDPYNQTLAQRLNRRAKHSLVSHEIFYIGEFKNGDRIDFSGADKNIHAVSPLDGYEYDALEDGIIPILCWRHTADPVTGLAGFVDASGGGKGSFWGSIRRFGYDYNSSFQQLDTFVHYYRRTVFANSVKVTDDGLMALFLFCRRGTIAATGLVAAGAGFADQSPSDFQVCNGLFDARALKLAKNIRFAELRKEFRTPSQVLVSHANFAGNQNGFDGYIYDPAEELFWLWEMQDTGAVGGLPDGALLTLHYFMQRDGVAYIATLYAEPDGATILANTGRLNVAGSFKFRLGNGDPIDPATGQKVPSTSQFVPLSQEKVLEGATTQEPFVVVDAVKIFLDPSVSEWGPYPIIVYADGAPDTERNVFATVRLSAGLVSKNSNTVNTGNQDFVEGDVSISEVDGPPTGEVLVELLVEKDNAALWTGVARAKVYLGLNRAIND